MSASETTFTKSSGNVFEDLLLPDADVILVKALVLYKIREHIKKERLSKDYCQNLLDLKLSELNHLMVGDTAAPLDWDLGKLLKICKLLGYKVKIQVLKSEEVKFREDIELDL